MQVTEIVDKLKEAAQCYYEGNPIMSDTLFDALVQELKQIDPQNPILKTVGWGYVLPKNQKYSHTYGLIGSLSKIHTVEEVARKTSDIIITPKFDGSTCVAYYHNGKLVRALSRGDGAIGVDKTAKYAEIIRKYDVRIPNWFTGAVRGEIVFSVTGWNKYKETHPEAKFPRNISTGMFMSDEISDDLQFVDFMAYKIVAEENNKYTTDYYTILTRLSNWGFPSVNYIRANVAHITNETCKKLFEQFSSQFPIDGLVFNFGVEHKYTGENIFDDIAYKFQAEAKLTTVKLIEWGISKNNLMIPVLNVDEVELSGANVSRVTAYNAQYVRDNNIGPGTELMVQRSGEVIPKVTEIVHSTISQLPLVCPVCGKELSWEGVHLICNNENCPNIQLSELQEWIRVIGCRNLLGVGDSVMLDFIHYYNLECVNDVYEHSLNSLEGLTSHQSKLYANIISNLFADTTPSEALQAMNIKGIGKEVSDKIADIVYDNLQDIVVLKNKLVNISGIGAAVANTIEKHFVRICNIFSYKIIKPASRLNNAVSQCVNVVITGAVSMPRKQFDNHLQSYGIHLIESISKADVLICNSPSSSSKYLEAQKRNIPILTEQEFEERYLK